MFDWHWLSCHYCFLHGFPVPRYLTSRHIQSKFTHQHLVDVGWLTDKTADLYKNWIPDAKVAPTQTSDHCPVLFLSLVQNIFFLAPVFTLNVSGKVSTTGPTCKFLFGPQTLHCDDYMDFFKALFSVWAVFYRIQNPPWIKKIRIARIKMYLVCRCRCQQFNRCLFYNGGLLGVAIT